MYKLLSFLFILILFICTSCTAYRYTSEITAGDIFHHLNYLASDELQGRHPGSTGDLKASQYIRKRLEETGLKVQRQEFSFVQSVKRGPDNIFIINGWEAPHESFSPFPFSRDTIIMAPTIFAGYGITVKADSFEWDDYKGIDVKSKLVLALRGSPDIPGAGDYLSMASDDRDKAMLAYDNGAAGLILVSGYRYDEADRLVKVERKQSAAGIPVIHISRGIADLILKSQNQSVSQVESEVLSSRRGISFDINAEVTVRSDIQSIPGTTSNIWAILQGSDPVLKEEYIVVGAHYDHLGYGGSGSGSRRPDTVAVHNGADDNASGVTALLELAGNLKHNRHSVKRSVLFVAFGAEEMGLLGSKYFVNNMPVDLSKVVAMVNLDMVGRLDTAKGIQVGGAGTSLEADSLINIANTQGLKIVLNREGYGPSDHASFYGKNIPVFFITTGAHTEYHTPADDVDRINIQGMLEVTNFTDRLVVSLANHPQLLTFREAGPKEGSGGEYRFKVTLGFMPDFSTTDIEGVRVDFVTKGKTAERGGIKNGDIITAIDGLAIRNIYDYMYRLGKLRPNQVISVEVLRDSKKEVLVIQL